MRYFYIDPLAAAWMSKHFGMKFIHNDDSLYAERYGESIEGRWPFELQYVGSRFYIHSDSLHLLEDRKGCFIWPESEE